MLPVILKEKDQLKVFDIVLSAVSDATSSNIDELLNRNCQRIHLRTARHIFTYICYANGMTQEAIAAYLNLYGHARVGKWLASWDKWINGDPYRKTAYLRTLTYLSKINQK